jgi:3-deoxy-D-manno-octulosonic-acid transferase
LGCKIFHGPYIYNFQEVYDLLKSYGVAEKVNNELELSKKIIKNLEGAKISNYKQIDLLNTYGEKILNETAVSLNMYLK